MIIIEFEEAGLAAAAASVGTAPLDNFILKFVSIRG